MLNQIPMTEKNIPLGQIKPGQYQHRQAFRPGALLELAGSIRESGLINRPVVYRYNGHHELLIGERRWRASCALAMAGAGLSLEQAVGIVSLTPPDPARYPVLTETTIPVQILTTNDPAHLQTLATVENLQREDLTPLEEARDFEALARLGNSNTRIAKMTGKAQSYVKGMLDWLALESEIQTLLNEGLLPKDHQVSAALRSIPDPALRLRLARQFATRRSPIRAIVAVCERAVSWPETQASPAIAMPVPVAQVKVEVSQAPAVPQTPTPCLCPACSIKLDELAEELCGGCRTHGLTAACLNCEGVIEFINRLISLNEAVYA